MSPLVFGTAPTPQLRLVASIQLGLVGSLRGAGSQTHSG